MMHRTRSSILTEPTLGSIFSLNNLVPVAGEARLKKVVPMTQIPDSLSDSKIRSIYKQADRLQTHDGLKLLAIHESLLIWFLSEGQELASQGDPVLLNQGSKRVPKIQAIVDISGYFVETYYSAKPGAIRDQKEGFTFAGISTRTNSKTMEGSFNVDVDGEQEENYSAGDGSHPRFLTFLPSNRRSYLRLRKDRDDSVGETIFFDIPEQQMNWLKKIALAPVIFLDFQNKYTIIQELGKQDGDRVFKIQNKSCSEVLDARMIQVSTGLSTADTEKLKRQILREVSQLMRLVGSGIVPNFRELFQGEQMFLIVQEAMSPNTLHFSDWFSNIWCLEYVDQRNPLPALSLMKELSNLVVSLHNNGIAHGNLTSGHILIQPAAPIVPVNSFGTVDDHTPKRGFIPRRSRVLENSEFLNKIYSLIEKPGKTTQNDQNAEIMNCSNNRPPFKLKLKGFGNYTSPKSRCQASKFADPAKTDQAEAAGDNISLSADVYGLAKIFVLIIFGVDLQKSEQRDFDSETNFAKSLQRGFTHVLFGLEPLFSLDPRIVVLMVQMFDIEASRRPQAHECEKIISEVLADCANKSLQETWNGTKKGTVYSPMTLHRLWSGAQKSSQQKRSQKLITLLSSPNAGFNMLSFQNQPSGTCSRISGIRQLPVVNPQECEVQEEVSDLMSSRKQESTNLIISTSRTTRDAPNRLKLAEWVPPGAWMRKLKLDSGSKENNGLLSARHSTTFAQTSGPKRSLSLPGVLLTGRSYFSIQNKLKNVEAENDDLSSNNTFLQLADRTESNLRRTPNASTKPKLIPTDLLSQSPKQRRLSLDSFGRKMAASELKYPYLPKCLGRTQTVEL